MDTRTRHALKKDSFAQAAASGASWLSGHRSSVARWAISAGVVLVLVVGSLIFWSVRSAAADRAIGAALDTYNAPLAEPGEPPEAGVFATAAERAKLANQQFLAVAQEYGWLHQAAEARYFAGVTYVDLGQTSAAEQELKQAASSWNRNLANLAKLALAGLYQQSGQSDQAANLYNELIAKPSATVPATTAQLDLADLYAAQGKQEQARALWARIRDTDKEGEAGAVAAQRLAAK
ncbi:MAG: tetratricopeptide repeat protein [Acidobacteriota bacterium]